MFTNKFHRFIYTILTLFLVILFAACSEQIPIEFTGRTMGTSYMVKVSDKAAQPADIQTLKNKVDTLLKKVNMQMSTYLPNSEISLFNQKNDTSSFPIYPELAKVLKLSAEINQESGGAFDITVGPLVDLWGFGKKGNRESPPSNAIVEETKKYIGFDKIILGNNSIAKKNPKTELDLSAVAKGYGVDVVADLLSKLSYQNFLVEIGGEVVAKGLKHDKKWRVGVDRPDFGAVPGQELEAVLEISDCAVATSGDYRNYFVSEDRTYSHTIDPVTGYPIVNGVASATVVAPDCATADAIATALMVMGAEKGFKWIESKPEIEAYLILREYDQYKELMTSGFHKYLEIESK
jgi:thiamine biosynthesis lipoprotein